MQGEVHFYEVIYTSERYGQQNKTVGRNITNLILNDLQPGTQYTFVLWTSNGAHTIVSKPVIQTTDDGGLPKHFFKDSIIYIYCFQPLMVFCHQLFMH